MINNIDPPNLMISPTSWPINTPTTWIIIPSRMNRFVFVLYSCSIFLCPFALGGVSQSENRACSRLVSPLVNQTQAEEMKSSLCVSSEALRLPFLEHKGRKRSCACLPSVARNFLRIPDDDCLQRCKLLSADFSRLIVLTVYGLVPFIVSFTI